MADLQVVLDGQISKIDREPGYLPLQVKVLLAQASFLGALSIIFGLFIV